MGSLGREELSPEGDQHNVAACYYNLGEVFRHRGEQDHDREFLEKSTEAFTRALSAFEATGNRALAQQAERNRGTVQALLETYIG